MNIEEFGDIVVTGKRVFFSKRRPDSSRLVLYQSTLVRQSLNNLKVDVAEGNLCVVLCVPCKPGWP